MRTVMAFQSAPSPQYVGVSRLTFPEPPALPGMYKVPSYPMRFPNPQFNKDVDHRLSSAQVIYNYERTGRTQF